jgi:hypothetical protein
MKVGKVKEVLSDYLDDSEVFAAIYVREEADEHIENHYAEEQQPALTDEEWHNIVALMSVDDGIWQEICGAFEHYIEATLKKRKEKANVGSE